MKKLLFTLCCMIFAIASFAQSNVHIKFMGIPITGTIAQFQAKLVAKGCTYNKVASASISNGTRAFKGTFVGNKVDIYVYYDTNTKIVYRTKAVVSGVSEDIAEQEYRICVLYIFHLLCHYFNNWHRFVHVITCHIAVSSYLLYNFSFWHIYLLTVIIRSTFITYKENYCS